MAIIISDDLIINVVVNNVETKTIDNQYATGAPGTYVPGKDFSPTDNVSAGVVTSYQIGISLSSKTNQNYPIDKLFLQSADDPQTNGTGSIPFYLLNSNPNPQDITDDMQYTLFPGYHANMTSVVLGPEAGITSQSTVNMTLNVNYPDGVYWKTKIAPKIYAVAIKDNIEQKSDLLRPLEVRMSSIANLENNLFYQATEWSGIRLTTVNGQKGFIVPFYMQTKEEHPANLAILLDSPNPDTITYEANIDFTIDGAAIPLTLSQITTSLQSGMPGVSIDSVTLNGTLLTVVLKRNGNMSFPVTIRPTVFLPYDPGDKLTVTMHMNASWNTPAGVIWNNWINAYIFNETTIGGFSASQIIPLQFTNPPTLLNSVNGLIQPPSNLLSSFLSYTNLNFISTAGSKMMLLYDSEVSWISDAVPFMQISYVPLGEVVPVTFNPPANAFLQQYAYVPLPSGYDPNAISQNVFDGSVTVGTYAEILAAGHKPNVLVTTILTDVLSGLNIDYSKTVSIYYQKAEALIITSDEFLAMYNANPTKSFTSHLYTAMQIGTNFTTVADANAAYGTLLGTDDKFELLNNKVYLYLATNPIGTPVIKRRFNTTSTVRSDIAVPVYRSYFETSITTNGKDALTSIFDYTQTYFLRLAFTAQMFKFSVDGKMLAGTMVSFAVPAAVQPYLYLAGNPGIYDYNLLNGTKTLLATVSSYALLPGVIQVVLPEDVTFHTDSNSQINLIVPVRFIPPSQNITFTHENTTYDPNQLRLAYPNQIVTGFPSSSPYYIVAHDYYSTILQGAGVDFSGLTVDKNFYPSGTSVTYIATVKNESNASDSYYMALTVPTNQYNALETSNNTQAAFINQIVAFNSGTVIYYQTAAKATPQDIQAMKDINQPGTNLQTYYNTVITSTWTQFHIGDVLPGDVVMLVAYTPNVATGSIVRVDYKVTVQMDPNTTETYINDNAFNYYSSASNIETQSNKVTIQNYNPNLPIPITKAPETQNVIAQNGRPASFTIQFTLPQAAIDYTSLLFSDQLPKALTLLASSTIKIGQAAPVLLNAQMSSDKLVTYSFTNLASLAGQQVTIVLNTEVDDITKIPVNGIDHNQAQLIVDGSPDMTYSSNTVEVVYQFANPFNIQKSPLTQQKPKVLNTPVSFTITFNVPQDVSQITSMVITDNLDPSLSYDANNSFLQIGATPIGLLPASFVNHIVTSDLTSYIAQAAGQTVRITLGVILSHPELLPVNETIDNRAVITLNQIPAYSFTSNVVNVVFSSAPQRLPIIKMPLLQTKDLVVNTPVKFTLTFTLPQDVSEYRTIDFSDILHPSLQYDATNSTVKFGSATAVPLNATVTGNTIAREFTNLMDYAGMAIVITVATTLAHPELLPTDHRIINVGQLIVNDEEGLTSVSNEAVVIFKRVNPHQPGINDVIESVALMQTALSHILNAEGEKIQKAMQLNGITANQLLDINDSVRATVNSISKLEIILISKLNLVNCDGCK